MPLGVVLRASSVSSDDSIAMLTDASPAMSAASGAESVSTTVDGSGASMPVTLASVLAATAAVASSWILVSESTTSAESKALPSSNTTPSRRCSVTVRPSSEVSHDVASPGTTLRSWSNSVSVP